jgi:hypothetical protein
VTSLLRITTTTDDCDHFLSTTSGSPCTNPITLIGRKSVHFRHYDRMLCSQTMDLHNTKFSLSNFEGVFTLSCTCDIKCLYGGTKQNLRINVKLKSKSRQQIDQPTQPSGERVKDSCIHSKTHLHTEQSRSGIQRERFGVCV